MQLSADPVWNDQIAMQETRYRYALIRQRRSLRASILKNLAAARALKPAPLYSEPGADPIKVLTTADGRKFYQKNGVSLPFVSMLGRRR